jgi:hypothetical protein
MRMYCTTFIHGLQNRYFFLKKKDEPPQNRPVEQNFWFPGILLELLRDSPQLLMEQNFSIICKLGKHFFYSITGMVCDQIEQKFQLSENNKKVFGRDNSQVGFIWFIGISRIFLYD